MSIKLSVFIATSLDGFIARENGSIDWLTQIKAPPGEDCGYKTFISTVDCLVMGRNTYEKVLSFDEWPYGSLPVIVLSSQKISIPENLQPSVSSSAETPNSLVERLSKQGFKHLYIDGGVTIQRFLAADLIDELTITFIPVLLGSGLRLFGPVSRDIALNHVSTCSYDFGVVQVKYLVSEGGN